MPDKAPKKNTDTDISEAGKATPSHKTSKKAKTRSNSTSELKAEIKKKDEAIENLKAEVKQLKDDYLRQLADKDNLRKRLEKEKSDFFQYALSETLKEMLTVLDNFERALKIEEEDEESEGFRNGVDMIFRQLKDVLNKQGVSPIEIEDKIFDPRFHQALATQESTEVSRPEIADVLQTGYMYRDRLLRPALVRVLVPAKGSDQ